MYKSLFVSVVLMSFALHTHADTGEKREVLSAFLDEIYPEVAVFNDTIKEPKETLKKQLQSFLSTCPFNVEQETTTVDTSAFLNAISCYALIEKTNTSASGMTRFQMKQIIHKLGETQKIDEARQESLLASVNQIYGQESSEKAEVREQLITYFQDCDTDYGKLDNLKFWSDAFGCKGIIETAKDSGIAYFEIQDAIEAAFPEQAVVAAAVAAPQVEVVDVPSKKPKQRERGSKP